jgi:hypothetical protein
MSSPISNPTKTLQIDKSSSEVNEAIVFIPALSAKYKIATANPEQQMYTLSGAELASDGAYIDICCSSTTANKTDVRLEVRRTTGLFDSRDASLAIQHLNTLSNLLSDSLALDPSKKSRLLSLETNKTTAGEHRLSQAMANNVHKEREETQATAFMKQMLFYVVSVVLLIAVLYGLYWYFQA